MIQSEAWSERRNKMKALREALRAGQGAMEKFVTLFELSKDELFKDAGTFGNYGWDNDQCTLFDATELADIHIPIPGHETKES